MRNGSVASAICRRFIDLFSMLVPRQRRSDWRREWNAEVVYVHRGAPSPALTLFRHIAGAPRDALSLLREEWNFDMILQDLKLAWRGLSRRPGFTAIAIFTLALGIGASIAIFSLVDAVLLQPLPYGESAQLVRIYGTDAESGQAFGNLNPLDVRDWNQGATLFEGIVSFNTGTMTLTGEDQPVRLETGLASPNFLDVMQVQPMLGRGFAVGEDVAGNHRVALLGHAFWQRQFAGDPAVVGRTIALDGSNYEIIGVLGPDFVNPLGDPGDEPLALWRPLAYQWDEVGRGGHFMRAVGRIADGVSMPQAQAELSALAAATAEEFPNNARGRGASLVSLRETMVGDARSTLTLMSTAVVLLLVIACGNVANLVLARGIGRRQELAVRTALGAGRGRLVRQLFTESLVLALTAGVLGVGLARIIVGVLATSGVEELPRLEAIGLDVGVAAFALGVSLATAVAFGLAPALLTSGKGLGDSLKGHASASLARTQSRVRAVLVVGEVALSTVLLAGAALMVQSMWSLANVDPGFVPEGVLTARISLPSDTYPEDSDVIGFHQRLNAELAAMPGVVRAAGANMLPFTGAYSCDSFALEDRPAPPEGQEPCTEVRVAIPGYFETMEIPLVAGRFIAPTDNATDNPVIVINEAMADAYWPAGNALGQRFKYGSFNSPNEPWRTIVGVVGNIRHFGFREAARPEVYFPHVDWSVRTMYAVLRVDGDAAALLAPVRETVRNLDDSLPVFAAATMEDRIAETLTGERVTTRLLLAFAVAAMVLATVGLYGVLAYNVSLRGREIGLRMALGARPADVVSQVVRQGAALGLLGIGIGLAGALAVTGLLSQWLFEVSPTDPLTLAAVAALLLLAAITASWLPARRAARIDPLVSLRQ